LVVCTEARPTQASQRNVASATKAKAATAAISGIARRRNVPCEVEGGMLAAGESVCDVIATNNSRGTDNPNHTFQRETSTENFHRRRADRAGRLAQEAQVSDVPFL
jgi:hypothetical protein